MDHGFLHSVAINMVLFANIWLEVFPHIFKDAFSCAALMMSIQQGKVEISLSVELFSMSVKIFYGHVFHSQQPSLKTTKPSYVKYHLNIIW